MSDQNVIKKSSLTPTVLIVGGAGFIGSHLSERLLLKNARVIVADNFSTGKDVFVHSLLKNPKFALFDVDINKGIPDNIKSVDYVIHLAGLETYLFDKGDINLDSLLTNAVGTKNVLDFSHASGAKFLLVSTVDVYKGLISPLNIDTYFGQTEQEEKVYSLAEAKRYAEALVWEYYKRERTNVRIARVPEVYGPRMNLMSSGNLGRLLKAVIDNQDLIVYGEGTEKEYYLYIEDVISGLIKALFTDNSEGKIYTFLPKEAHSVLEITYLVKSLANKEMRVLFRQKQSKPFTRDLPNLDTSNLKELNWMEKQSFKEGIVNTLRWLGYEPNEHSFKPNKLISEKEKEKSGQVGGISSITSEDESNGKLHLGFSKEKKKRFVFNKLFRFKFKRHLSSQTPTTTPSKKWSNIKTFFAYLFLFTLFLAVFIGVPFVQTYVHTKVGIKKLQNVQESVASFDSTNAQELSNEAYLEFYKAQRSLSRVKWVFTATGQKRIFNDVQHLFDFGKSISKTTYYLAKGATPFLNIWESLNPTSAKSIDLDKFSDTNKNFITAQESINLAQASFNEVQTDFIKNKILGYDQKIDQVSGEIEFLLALSSDITQLLGFDVEKNYLILFQNSNELRATGGFIGSYAVLTVKEGKIENLSIDDIYNPDGQIDLREIEVEPPAPIKNYLNEDVLHIRNANWEPDFTKSAEKIESLFFKIDGRKFDGVIATDLYFVEDLLEVTGPVFLAAYNEEIDAQNLYERAQFHSEFNYTEGSDQKRAFLTVLGGKLLESLFALDKSNLALLGTKMQQSFNEKHLLLDISSSPLNKVLTKRGWNGTVNDTKGDYLFVVNSNLGGTKANYYVKNNLDYSVFSATRDGLLRGELSLNYDHTGLDSSWPGGPYTNYVRVLTQFGSKLTGASILFSDGTSQDIFDLVTTSTKYNKTQFDVGFVLEPNTQATLILNYDLPNTLAISKETQEYSLYWQKQPGTNDDNVSFKFNAPFGVNISKTTPQMETGSNSLKYTGVLNKDMSFSVGF